MKLEKKNTNTKNAQQNVFFVEENRQFIAITIL